MRSSPWRTYTNTLARLRLGLPLLAVAALIGAGSVDAAPGAVVYVLPTTGVVDGVMASYIEEGISRAEADGARALVIELNTPGGSLDATQKIVSALLEATVPTITWVAPAGSKAASAGTFITLAAGLAYMAPGTNIGAASPVDSSGNDIPGTLGQKVKNDAIASIRSIAETRGHNVDWAVSTVDKAVSSPASEAVSLGAVNGFAASTDELRSAATGQVITIGGHPVTVDLRGTTFQDLPMNPFQSFLHLLSDPNIAALLFSLGSLGLLYELMNPNFVTGILGALAIILAFIGFGSLPLNVAGLLLILLGLVLFGLEATVTSHGLLTVGGVVAFVLGASSLYTTPGNPAAPDVTVAAPLIATIAGLAGAFGVLIAYVAIRTRRMVGSPGLVGAAGGAVGNVAIVAQPLTPRGSVLAGGETWSARAADGRELARGAEVRVVGQEGLTLIVEPRDVVESGTSGRSGDATAAPRPGRPQVQQ